MKRVIKELQEKENNNLHHLQREAQLLEFQQMAEQQMNNYRDKFEAEIDSLKQQYDRKIQEMEKQKKNVARSISNKRSSVSGSQWDSGRRHSSAKASRNRASRNGNETSFTVEGRYPVKRKGIGEQTPPRLDLDQYPTRDRKFDRSIKPVILAQNGGLKRFKDQVYYEQIILNLEEKLGKRKDQIKDLNSDISELKRINKALEIENKIAISLILNGNNSKGYNPNWHNDEKVAQIIKTIQYILDCNNEDSSSNLASSTIEESSFRPRQFSDHEGNIKKLKNDIINTIINADGKSKGRDEYDLDEITFERNSSYSPDEDKFEVNKSRSRSPLKTVGNLSTHKREFDKSESDESDIINHHFTSNFNKMYSESPPVKDNKHNRYNYD